MITRNKNCKIKALASIRSGVYRKSIPNGTGTGTVHQIQKGNFDEEGNLLPLPNFPELAMDLSLQKHVLKANEILVNAKGDSNVAYLFPEIPQTAVASSVFLILTLESEHISAHYLTWYLNTQQCQQSLAQISRGSAVHSLAKRDLQQVVIPLPSLQVQRAIVRLAKLQKAEHKLYKQLIVEKKHLMEAQLLQLTNTSTLPQTH